MPRKRFFLRAAWIVTTLGIAAPVGAAAEDGAKALAPGDEIIVVGEREKGYRSTEQSSALFGARNILRTPFSVSSFSQEVLIDQQVRKLGDIVRNDPSATVSSPPGFNDTINIRGFTLDNSNGYRREGLIFQNQVQNPFENKAAVEILKGPAALRYGFANPGGVVNYILKRPTPETYRYLELFGDTNGSIGAHFDLGAQLTDEIGVRINALGARDASFVDGVAGPRHMFSAFVEWRPSDRLRIDLEAEYEYREQEQQATIADFSFDPSVAPAERKALIEAFDQTTFLGAEFGTYPTRNFVGSVRAVYELADDWTLTAAAQKMNLIRDQQGVGIGFGTLAANGDYIADTFFSPSQIRDPLSAEAYVTGSFRTGPLEHTLTVGAAFSDNPLRFELVGGTVLLGPSNIFNPQPQSLPPGGIAVGQPVDAIVFQQVAGFFTDAVRIGDKVEIIAGGRYTRQRTQDVFNADETLQTSYDDGAFTPTVGAIFAPIGTLSFYASWSQGITQGAVAPMTVVNANEILPPERSRAFEAGVKADVLTGATVTAAIFDIEQPRTIITPDNIFTDGGSQRHRGAEITIAGDVADGLRLIAGGLYLDADVDDEGTTPFDGLEPQGVPEFQANLYADWRTPFARGLWLNGGVFYTGERFADDANTYTVDGYVRVDLGARYEFSAGGADYAARLIVRNALDADFVEGTNFGIFYFGAPRTAFLSLSRAF